MFFYDGVQFNVRGGLPFAPTLDFDYYNIDFLFFVLRNDTNADAGKDLFNVQIGRVSRVSLVYGPQGTSKGVATVQFSNKGDAKKAYDRYDGKLIDNTRRMKVHIPQPHAPGVIKPSLSLFLFPTIPGEPFKISG